MHLRTILLFVLTSLAFHTLCEATYQDDKLRAERFFNEKSYAQAYEIYTTLPPASIPESESEWVQFRIADTLWRSRASASEQDDTPIRTAQEQMETLARSYKSPSRHDLVWAELQQSLGDLHWTRARSQDWHAAWPHYHKALEWWAACPEVELARYRYIQIIRTLTAPPFDQHPYLYGYHVQNLPLEIVENFARIAGQPQDSAYAHYLLAIYLQNNGDITSTTRARKHFQKAIQAGKQSPWYDDALFHYAQFLSQRGRIIHNEDGTIRMEPDFTEALNLLQRFVREFPKGASRFHDQAKNLIREISRPSLDVRVSNAFLPGSEIAYSLTCRNTGPVQLSLHPVLLPQEVRFPDNQRNSRSHQWKQYLTPPNPPNPPNPPTAEWTIDPKDEGQHLPYSKELRLEKKLPRGAYLLTARSGSVSAKEIVLITDAALILKTSPTKTLAYFCDSATGAPIPGATLTAWHGHRESRVYHWQSSTFQTDANGLAEIPSPDTSDSHQLFISASIPAGEETRQAFALGHHYSPRSGQQQWRILATTDRPAYRPQETVHWKATARTFEHNLQYATPQGETIRFNIIDPRGTTVSKGEATLNAFGSYWDSFELSEDATLGPYHINFNDTHGNHLGSTTLFRLEEYKLPEFKVSITTPEQDGRPRTFRPGDEISATVQADYLFGAPVAGAKVEAIVRRTPLYHDWRPDRPYPWFFKDLYPHRPYYGGGEVVERLTLTTDARGKANLSFSSPEGSTQDFEYHIEARVTDASRREILGKGAIKVTRQSYRAHAQTQNRIQTPGSKASIDFTTLDPNDNPIPVKGTVRITRDTWHEIWITPEGNTLTGKALQEAKARCTIFPPPVPGWRPRHQGYQQEKIETRTLSTDKEGKARLSFTPPGEGFYTVTWSSPDPGAPAVTTSASVWVADARTRTTGYHAGGVEIIMDRDTFKEGEEVPIMLSTQDSDRYVLFSVQAEDFIRHELVHVTGTAKLIHLKVSDAYLPNVFLDATMVSAHNLFSHQEQAMTPPEKHFLNLTISPSQKEVTPRTQSTFALMAKDHTDQPVSAEISFSLVDESVFYIQKSYTPDPREFYFGSKRPNRINTQSTFQQLSYVFLTPIPPPSQPSPILQSEQVNEYRGGGDAFLGQAAGRSRRLMKAMSAPAPAMEGMALSESDSSMMMADKVDMGATASTGSGGEGDPVVVRSDFRTTAVWVPDVRTESDGTATVDVTYPDSTTGWKATALAATEDNLFGEAHAETRSTQPLIARIQAPRFFTTGDRAMISGLFDNNTSSPITCRPSLDAEGLTITSVTGPDGRQSSSTPSGITIPANGQARIDWTVGMPLPGTSTATLTAKGDRHSDAMRRTFPIYEYGMEQFIAHCGKTRSTETSFTLDIPGEKAKETAEVHVHLSPSIATTMLDALPYLIHFPYGCTEQTMSRFLPAVMVARSLDELGLDGEKIVATRFGGIEPNHASKTHSKNPEELTRLRYVIRKGLARLYDLQHQDGGWGWWKDGDSDPYMSAYVYWGLVLCEDAGVDVRNGVTTRARAYLERELVNAEREPNLQAWMLHALSARPHSSKSIQKALENTWNLRDSLTPYSRALLALALHQFGDKARAAIAAQNLSNDVVYDKAPSTSTLLGAHNPTPSATEIATAHWGASRGYYRWYQGGIEATAFALKALLAIEPDSPLIEPAMNWLVKNRRGAQWSNTRDTSYALLALTDYLRKSGESKTHMDFELTVNGTSVLTRTIHPTDVFKEPSVVPIPKKLVRAGENTFHIRTSEGSPLYFSTYATYFTQQQPIPPAGHEIFIKREYFLRKARPTLLKGFVYDLVPLKEGDSLKSGDRIEVVLTVETKNDYEYLIFEDLKPSGFEAVQIRSGETMLARELRSGLSMPPAMPSSAPAPLLAPVAPPSASTPPSTGNAPSFPNAKPLPMPVPRAISTASHAISTASAPAPAPMIAKRRRLPSSVPLPPMDNSDATRYTGKTRRLHQELRDRKVAFFADRLSQGQWEIRYELRAETPGTFSALPAKGHAMYVPELRCNSESSRFEVTDTPQAH